MGFSLLNSLAYQGPVEWHFRCINHSLQFHISKLAEGIFYPLLSLHLTLPSASFPVCLIPCSHQVALQFPDELLADAVEVAGRMEAATGAETYVLGDTTYGRSVWGCGGCPGAPLQAGMGRCQGGGNACLTPGSPCSCCVDEVAAEHVGAQAVLHYGPACLSPCRKLPVLHVFGQQPLDVGRCTEAFRELYPEQQSCVVVLYDVVYAHAMGECFRAWNGGLWYCSELCRAARIRPSMHSFPRHWQL